MNILEGNKLIAAFMEHYHINDGYYRVTPQKCYHLEELQYHSSWDWLMPVIEKIDQTYEVSIIGNECEIAENGYEWKSICKSSSESKIDAVYQTIVKFIQNHV